MTVKLELSVDRSILNESSLFDASIQSKRARWLDRTNRAVKFDGAAGLVIMGAVSTVMTAEDDLVN